MIDGTGRRSGQEGHSHQTDDGVVVATARRQFRWRLPVHLDELRWTAWQMHGPSDFRTGSSAVFRITLVQALVLSLFPVTAYGADDDSTRKQLEKARKAYATETAKLRESVFGLLEKAKEFAQKSGNKSLVDQLERERIIFNEIGEMPSVVPAAKRQKAILVGAAMESAFQRAIKEYTQQNKQAQAAAVAKELAALQATRATEIRFKWVHEGGTFAHKGKGEWSEDAPTRIIYQFKEVVRTSEYVELFDVNRTVRVKLYKDKCDVSLNPDDPYRTFYNGKWSR